MLDIDTAIKHCLEVAEQNETQADKIGRQFIGSAMDKRATDCRECAADHRQLAEWLTELKEAKRLLKAAVEDMYNSVNDVHCKYCSKWHTDQCQGTSHLDCYVENKFKWRYAAEALALIGEDTNVPASKDGDTNA